MRTQHVRAVVIVVVIVVVVDDVGVVLAVVVAVDDCELVCDDVPVRVPVLVCVDVIEVEVSEVDGLVVMEVEVVSEVLGVEVAVVLVVSDVVMPNMDGPAMARKLRRQRPDLPILFMSGYAEEQLRESIDLDNIGFLPKPFSVQQIAEAVGDVLRASRKKD